MSSQEIEKLETKIAELQSLVEKMKNKPDMRIIPGALYEYWDHHIHNAAIAPLDKIIDTTGDELAFQNFYGGRYKHCRLRKNQLVDIPDDWMTAPPIVGRVNCFGPEGVNFEGKDVKLWTWNKDDTHYPITQVLILDDQPELEVN